MTKADMPNLRQLAKNGQITYSDHAIDQMCDRDISHSDVENILCSGTNQLIEVQSPSNTPGKRHRNERILISDPTYPSAIIVILVILTTPLPVLHVVTVEHVHTTRWDKNVTNDPWLTRK